MDVLCQEFNTIKEHDFKLYFEHYPTKDELEELYGFPRRRLERLMSVLIEQFGDKVEVVENSTDRKKHFRLKKNTINSLISFSSNDFVKLEKLKQLLNDENEKKKLII